MGGGCVGQESGGNLGDGFDYLSVSLQTQKISIFLRSVTTGYRRKISIFAEGDDERRKSGS